MNILLDECVPWPLRKLLADHTCQTAQQMGWKSVKNGELLALAEGKFDLFITSDQSLAYQQNLRGRRICRRLSRLTNAFSKKFENFKAAVALHYGYYNFEIQQRHSLHASDGGWRHHFSLDCA